MSQIEVNDVSFSYENDEVLNNINFEINQGDYIGVIGGNGTGKSTLIKLLLGELVPTQGKITRNYNNIVYIPQNAGQISKDFPATVFEAVSAGMYKQIGLFGFISKKQKEKVMSAIETVGMTEYKDRLIGKLSGGQQQRVSLAKMLVSEPEIIFLDEPTNGIDKNSEHTLYELLDKLNKENKITVIMITHDITGVTQSVNRVLFLENSGLREISVEDTCLHEHTHGHNHHKEDK